MELPRNELPVSEYFDFTTQHKKEADYMGKNANRYHKIFPNEKILGISDYSRHLSMKLN